MTLIERPPTTIKARSTLVPIETRLPRTRFETLTRDQGGTVTFITEWLASHALGNACEACEGVGFCLRCDARGCDECHGGLCERCNGLGLRLDTIRS
jgi:hypothetical protein